MLTKGNDSLKRGGDFDPIPADRYTALIADVNPAMRNKWHSTEKEEQYNFQFTILDDKPMPVRAGKPAESTRGRFIWHSMTKSIGAKSWLLRLVRAAYQRDPTDAEYKKFEDEPELALNAIVGKQVDIMVTQSPNKDRTAIYSNIIAYQPCLKQLSVPEGAVAAKTQEVRESVTTPAVAPDETDPDKFIAGLEAEAAPLSPEEKEAAELREKLKVAEEKAAKAKTTTK